ncbi:hypothetical protein [Dankookia sp. P2]|uniref:hypothetical protein n=1 Tax=Dankookia sp. P2 TaxID=3423955 RepID=UPI003D67D1B6
MPGEGEPYDPDAILPEMLEIMRPGDVLAHPFTRHPGGFVDRHGALHPVVREALARGLKVDVGHGSHFSFRMARLVIDAGVVPDTLGADMHGYNTTLPKPRGTPETHPDKEEMHLFAGKQNFSLASAMTSMLALGLTLRQVVPMVSTHCAAMLRMQDEIGALRPGAEADISVLHDERGRFRLEDNEGHGGDRRPLPTPGLLPARRPALRRGFRGAAAGRAGRGRVSASDARSAAELSPPRQDGAGVGASLRRKEDTRFLHGRGRYVGDIRPAGTLEVAFLRSPVAHARLLGVAKPGGAEHRVFTAEDLPEIGPIRANSALPGFRPSEQPALARGKLRHVGEPVAACVAATRAEAEDLAAACRLQFEALPAIADMLAACAPARR